MGLGPRPVVSGLAIRDYAGDCEDVAALGQKVWTATYGNTMWFPLWDAAFLRWQIGGGALAPGADANSSSSTVGAERRTHRAPLPINETQDPDHYLPPASGTIRSGSTSRASVSSNVRSSNSSTFISATIRPRRFSRNA